MKVKDLMGAAWLAEASDKVQGRTWHTSGGRRVRRFDGADFTMEVGPDYFRAEDPDWASGLETDEVWSNARTDAKALSDVLADDPGALIAVRWGGLVAALRKRGISASVLSGADVTKAYRKYGIVAKE